MPERLMGTDCKFVGDMSTLVQIQLGPKISPSMSMTKSICPTKTEMPNLIHINKEKKSIFCSIHIFLTRSDLSNDLYS